MAIATVPLQHLPALEPCPGFDISINKFDEPFENHFTWSLVAGQNIVVNSDGILFSRACSRVVRAGILGPT